MVIIGSSTELIPLAVVYQSVTLLDEIMATLEAIVTLEGCFEHLTQPAYHHRDQYIGLSCVFVL